MTRRKSVCTKWTLVLVLFVLCQTVFSRPQDDTVSGFLSSTQRSATDRSSENPIRYRFKSNFSLSTFVSPRVAIRSIDNSHLDGNSRINKKNNSEHNINGHILYFNHNLQALHSLKNVKNISRRTSRLIGLNNSNQLKHERNANGTSRAFSSISKLNLKEQNQIKDHLFTEKNKPIIRKVITKWTDETKYEDLDFNNESSDLGNNKQNSKDINDYASREDISSEISELSKDNHPKLTKKVYYKPRPQYSEQYPANPPNIQYIDNYSYNPTRPTYVFTTPSPTPIITNVGYPPPWPQQNYQVIQPVTTTQRPIRVTNPVKDHYNYHNNNNNYPQYPANNFEVTTFPPTSAYTDRIVIRPEEYSASPDDCPTIYLTLNNTFQGQAKEACPDLNIAVNTNVVNKNVVVESEEDTESSFADAFGIPLMGDSESGDNTNDYNESADDEDAESASIEGTALTNYNANTAAQDSAEPGNFASPSSALSTISRPGRPTDNDDDVFGFSSIIDFFRPALNAFNWLAAINPLSFGIISFILTPLAILFAGTSGLAAIFAPLALTYAREAPKIQMHPPQLFWDSNHKILRDPSTHYKGWGPITHKIGKVANDGNEPSVKPTLFYRIKEWMKNVTQKLRNDNGTSLSNSRKNKRRKREIWTSTVK